MSAAKSLLTLFGVLAALALASFPKGASHAAGGGQPADGSQTPPTLEKREWRLLFTGDILLSRGVELRLRDNPRALAHALQPALAGADFAAGNLEGAVGSAEQCVASPGKAPCFPIRGEFIPLLREAGFKAIGLANNHSSDLGPEGKKAARELLEKAGVTALTYEDSPQFVRLGDAVASLVSFSMAPGRDGGFVEAPSIELRQKLRMARSLSNLTVAYVHWGSEFLDWPDKRQRRAAEWLVENGVDIVAGHHPHVVQKPESIRGKPVFYSLGNLVFDQKYPSTRDGLMADCRMSEGTVGCSALWTRTPDGSTLPAITGGDGEVEKVLSGCVVQVRPPLVVNGITLRPGISEEKEDSRGLTLEALRDGKILWKTRRAKIFSLEAMKVDPSGKARHLFTLERHFSSMDGEEGLRPCVYEVRPEGLVPRWRGTALAWPLVDAAFLPGNDGVLCALHRGDSFIAPGTGSKGERIAAYRWKGFGFTGIQDPKTIEACRDYYR